MSSTEIFEFILLVNLSVLVSQPVFSGRVWRCIFGFGNVFLGLYVGNPRRLLDVTFPGVVYLRKYLNQKYTLWAKIARKRSHFLILRERSELFKA